ncbi:MAG TPA: HDOD domain-containing protein [Bryobacteraceae bacterium]|nr:HDOD domain-containing protein [Bryobacteraceae bacterium]
MPILQESAGDMLANRSAAISRLSKLRPFHPAMLRLLSVPVESDSATDDFELILQRDPALASRLLRVANSPWYGFCGGVESVSQAIALMGLEGIRSLAITLAIRSHLRDSQTTGLIRSVWAHSLATAVIAETIGTAAGGDLPFLYIAGLLHDLGRLGLLNIEGERYAGVLTRKYFDLDESLLLEGLLFGCAHDDAGAFLGRAWGFPEPLCDCIQRHHQPSAAEGSLPLQQMVQLACSTASSLGMGEVECEAETRPALDGSLAERICQAPAMQPESLRLRIHIMVETLATADAHPQDGSR